MLQFLLCLLRKVVLWKTTRQKIKMHSTLSMWVSIIFSQAVFTSDAKNALYLSVNLFSTKIRPLLETGPPHYVAIRATQRSNRLQARGSTFDSLLKYRRPWVIVQPQELNLWLPALQCSQVLYWLCLPCCGHSVPYSIHTLSYKVVLWTNLVQASLRGTYSCFESHSPTTLSQI